MERIVLEVNSDLAKAWKKVPEKVRKQFEKDIEVRLTEEIRLAEIDNFNEALRKLRVQAENNGLTQDILEKLLNED